jgi:hypothetical protein
LLLGFVRTFLLLGLWQKGEIAVGLAQFLFNVGLVYGWIGHER